MVLRKFLLSFIFLEVLVKSKFFINSILPLKGILRSYMVGIRKTGITLTLSAMTWDGTMVMLAAMAAAEPKNSLLLILFD